MFRYLPVRSKRMGSSEEERLVQMVRDYIESESTTPISYTPSKPLQVCHKTSYVSLQEILKSVTDAEIEVLGRTLCYLKSLEAIGQANNLKKWVVLNLKKDGYEASLCKTSWATAFGRLSGDYEYIDVMTKDDSGGKPVRFIVDIDFRSQFEVARPTPTYKVLSNSLPSIFVGTEEKLNQIISILCSAAKQSMEERGLHIPPWRRTNYMQSKWLSENCKKVSFSPNREVGFPKFESESGLFCGSFKFRNWTHTILKH
ncbi:unnamed protein product [Ilex paraguariensis]|uniref:Uncharacterized protein n=1 Tax=Ilex paraguariensis TaxID=185542 RepID=A0ABC8R9H2_9AQUA